VSLGLSWSINVTTRGEPSQDPKDQKSKNYILKLAFGNFLSFRYFYSTISPCFAVLRRASISACLPDRGHSITAHYAKLMAFDEFLVDLADRSIDTRN
jgi:hypothetical protein